eukprot:scaffold16245_cov67-Phaeocystis_antarctica.AAC.3
MADCVPRSGAEAEEPAEAATSPPPRLASRKESAAPRLPPSMISLACILVGVGNRTTGVRSYLLSGVPRQSGVASRERKLLSGRTWRSRGAALSRLSAAWRE